MIKVEKDIPIPQAYLKRIKYPWDDMAVGDSFFLPGVKQFSAHLSATKRRNGPATFKTNFSKPVSRSFP